MKFSIVIPTYNGADTLAAAVETLLAQDFADWEAIIVDDGSKDATAAIAEGLARRDGRIRLARQPNGGVSVARNRGMDEARGEWIACLDQDDAFVDGALAQLAAIVAAHPDCSCLQFPYFEKQPDGSLARCGSPAYSRFGGREYTGIEAFDILFARRNVCGINWQPWRFVFRRDALPQFRAGVIQEDLDTLPLHLAKLPRVFIAREPYYAYLPGRSGSATAAFTPRRVRDMLAIMEHTYGELERMSLPPGVVRGFKATLAYNLFGHYLATPGFAEPDRSELLDAFARHGEWLRAIDSPPSTAWLKRLMLRVPGVRMTAIIVEALTHLHGPHAARKS